MEAIKRLFQVERRDINYLRWTIESYDGMAVVRTIDPYEAIIELRIAPGCEIIFGNLLDSLRKIEGIKLVSIQ